MLDCSSLEFVLSVRSLSHLGLTTSASGLVRLGLVFLPLIIEHTKLGLVLFVRSLAYLGFAMLVFGAACPEFFLLLQSHAHLEPTALAFGLTRLGLVFSLPVASSAILGFSSSPRSIGKPGSATFVPGMSQMDSLFFLRSSARFGFQVLVCGLTCLGLVFVLLVAERVCLEPLSFLRSFAQVDLAILTLDFASIESFPFVRSCSNLESAVFVSGFANTGSPSLALSEISMGFSSFLRSSA